MLRAIASKAVQSFKISAICTLASAVDLFYHFGKADFYLPSLLKGGKFYILFFKGDF